MEIAVAVLAVAVLVGAVVVGVLTSRHGHVPARGCCAPADPRDDARMRGAFDE